MKTRETILFLHGWGTNSSIFVRVMSFFENLSVDYKILALDLPMFACGDSDSPGAPWGLENYSDYVEQFLDKEGVENCHIIAHSFGARVAVLLCTRNLGRFGKLVLTGAAGLRKRLSFCKCLRVRFHKMGIWKNKGSEDYRKLTHTGKVTFQNILRRDLSGEIANLKNPTLLIWGRKDSATPLKMGKKWLRLQNKGWTKQKPARILIYRDSGHFCFLDEPERFIRDAHSFLVE